MSDHDGSPDESADAGFPGFVALDDHEPPTADEELLSRVQRRGRVLRTRRRLAVGTSALALVVVAAAGVTVWANPFGPSPDSVNVVSLPTGTPAPITPAPSGSASPSPAPSGSASPSPGTASASPSADGPPGGSIEQMPSSFTLTGGGVNPYNVGAGAESLRAKGWLERREGGMCSVSYEAVSPHDPADITVSVRDGSIQFVAVRSGYTTSAGAHVGMSVQALKDAYGSRLEPVGDSDNPTGFFMSSGSGYLSFVAPSGSVTAMAGAGSRITAQGIAGSGETYPC